MKNNKEETVREVIRVRFYKKSKPDIQGKKLGKPTRVYKYTTTDKEGKILKIEYKAYKVEGKFGKILDPDSLIIKWKKGPTPTPRPSSQYSKEELKTFSYSDELINKIHRGFSAKEVSVLRNKIGRKNITASEVRELLIKNNGSVHKVTTDQKEQIEKTTKNRLEGKKHAVNMGEHTHKKRKTNYKPGSKRGRKMIAKDIPQYKEDQELSINPQKGRDKKQQSKSQRKKNIRN